MNKLIDWYRIRHSLGLLLCPTAIRRAEYLKKHDILYHIGDNCMTMFRKIPLYPKLISLGDNVWIASGVTFVPHDVIHRMLNNRGSGPKLQEYIGCIDIRDNVFIGSDTTILPNVTIGSDTVIAAGSLVNKSIPGGGVYGGVPARYICSLDEFLAKRRRYPKIKIQKIGKGELSEETVNACWERFHALSQQTADV